MPQPQLDITEETKALMLRAICLAEKGRGYTWPNPLVGAVVVNNGKVVGEGYHAKAGADHAEIVALKQAGSKARNGTLIVTLEPCCAYGRTPPCTDQIIQSGIRKVIYGSLDPNPNVNGRGLAILEKAGVEVTDAGMREKVEKQNEVYFKYITLGKPFVHLKYAMSLDGRISVAKNKRTRLTGEQSRLKVRELRSQYGAIVTGVGTVTIDDPRLLAGKPDEENPLRVIVDSKARVPINSFVVQTAKQIPTFIATTKLANPSKLEKLNELDVNIIYCQLEKGEVDLADMLDWLGKMEITAVLIEAGPRLVSSFVRKKLVDKYWFFYAPLIIGEKNSQLGIPQQDNLMSQLKINKVEQIEDDVLIEAYPKS
jgi:diaminohydroxyphosphoribosylaminopyrimidine deaminase/5-amino-6-(5-phosphoribosylamino)uracil reductase